MNEMKNDISSHVKNHIQSTVYPARIVNTSAVISNLPVGVLVCSLTKDGSLDALFMNQFARDIFQTPENTQLPCPIELTWLENDHQQLSYRIKNVFSSNEEYKMEWSVFHGSVERHLFSRIFPLEDQSGEVYQVVCTLEDKTSEKLAERNLLHHAFHDSLTGLPNRVLFRSKLEEAVNNCNCNTENTSCAVLIINIDRFQQINETFGHSSGDSFLVAMVATLRKCIRTTDILARLSGDEFAILMTGCKSLDEVNAVADSIHSEVKKPYDLDGNEVFISVSIGIATTTDSSAHPESLIRNADYAMHNAKNSGKACSRIFKKLSDDTKQNNFHLETELRRAVERDELELYYQPIVNLETGYLKGFEALTRWNHKTRGLVSPLEFIPIAEETGIIVDLGRWALDKACKQISEWHKLLPAGQEFGINVNVSGIQFARDDVFDAVNQVINAHKIDPGMLTVELTESAIITNTANILKTLNALREKGVKVALDDFGTGYSSLNYLHQFPIDSIKIDRSFIDDLQQDSQKFKILNLIATFGHQMGFSLVAEGLEDLNHIQMMNQLEIGYGQGFYYSRPVKVEDATSFVNTNKNWSVIL